MPRPEWEIETTADGAFDVLHQGRIVKYDEDSLDSAAREVKRRGGTEYILTETDGYRTTHRV